MFGVWGKGWGRVLQKSWNKLCIRDFLAVYNKGTWCISNHNTKKFTEQKNQVLHNKRLKNNQKISSPYNCSEFL